MTTVCTPADPSSPLALPRALRELDLSEFPLPPLEYANRPCLPTFFSVKISHSVLFPPPVARPVVSPFQLDFPLSVDSARA